MVRIVARLHARPSDHSGSSGEEEGEEEEERKERKEKEARRVQEPRTSSKTSNEAGAKAAPPSQEPLASARPLLFRQEPISQQSVEQLFSQQSVAIAISQQSVTITITLTLTIAFTFTFESLSLKSFSLESLSQLQRISQLFPLAKLQPVLFSLSKL